MAGFSTNSADRCLAIIELLAQSRTSMAVTAIAQQTDLSPSATHRLLAVLRARGYVVQNETSEEYSASLLFGALAARVLEGTGILDICQPALDDLAKSSHELARFALLNGEELIWIAKAQGSHSHLRYDPVDGRSVPLHATAMGKAWLSSLPREEAIRIVEKRGLSGELSGPNVVTSMDAFMKALDEARDMGFGLVEEEAEAGVSAIAVVVREELTPEKPIVGCLSIGGPSLRLSRRRLIEFLPELRKGAETIGRSWIRRVALPAPRV